MWAIVVTHMCANWGTYTFLTNIPTYMKEVLKFDIRSVGWVLDFKVCVLYALNHETMYI